jgi:carbon storage regulator
MLIVTRKVGETVLIGDIAVTITRCSKGSVRIGIDAPPEVRITRAGALKQAVPMTASLAERVRRRLADSDETDEQLRVA